MEDIADADFKHAKNVWKDFELKNLGNYHGLHVESDMLFLANIFEKFCKEFIETYEHDPNHFLSAPGFSR